MSEALFVILQSSQQAIQTVIHQPSAHLTDEIELLRRIRSNHGYDVKLQSVGYNGGCLSPQAPQQDKWRLGSQGVVPVEKHLSKLVKANLIRLPLILP